MAKRTYLKRSGRKNRHHIKNKVRGGKRTPDNMILLDEYRHSAYHLLFSDKTFLEAARLLIRADRMIKRRE